MQASRRVFLVLRQLTLSTVNNQRQQRSLCLSSHLHRIYDTRPLPTDTPTHNSLQTRTAEVAELTLSPYLRHKLPPVKLAKVQRLWRDHQSPFLRDVADISDLSQLTSLVELHFDTLDTSALLLATDLIFFLIKDKTSSSQKRDLLNSVGLQKLWKLLRRKSRHMDPGDLINALKLLAVLNVPSNDQTLQLVLQVLTKHAHSLELSQVIYLHFLLFRLSPEAKSPLSTALEYALPVVFESQVVSFSSGQLDEETPQALCDYLYYAVRHGLGEKAIKSLVLALERGMAQLSARQTMSVLWSLGDAKKIEQWQEPLIRKCFSVVAENIHTFSAEDLSTLIGKAAKKVKRNVNLFYDETFLHAFCTKFMSRYGSPEQTLWSFKHLSLMRFVHVEYMDRVGELVASAPAAVLNNDFLFLTLVRAFSACNYRPEQWHKFEPMFLNHPALSKDLGVEEISLALDFLTLETYPSGLVDKIFSPEELPRLDVFLQRNPFHSAHSLLLLLNAVQLLHPEYSGSLPPRSMVDKWRDLVRHDREKRNYLLKPALQTGFGGEDYVINGLFHNGLHIDHAIVLRKGGFAIAQPASSSELSQLVKPAESEIVLVKVYYKEAYSNNTPRLRGLYALEQRVLERLGHPVVVVDAERWRELPDHEKIPFLMHRMREKVDKFQWNQSSSDVIPR